MKIYLDENLSHHVAAALNLLCKGDFADIEVLSTIDKFGRGATDEVIIPALGDEGGILISRDLHIVKTRHQHELCNKYKLGAFFLKLSKGESKHWEIVKLLISKWEGIIEKCRSSRKPFGYIIHKAGKFQPM